MHVVSIYNNKGGVGKSTLAIALAEFLAANLSRKVVLIDMDAQASSASAILGRKARAEAIKAKQTMPNLAAAMYKKQAVDLGAFLTTRPASSSRGTALQSLSVLVPHKPAAQELETRFSAHKYRQILRSELRPQFETAGFDYVLIDLPGNLDRRSHLAIDSMVMSDFIVVPIEPSQITLEALPETFELVSYVQDVAGNGRPQVLGFILNKTDRRTAPYRRKIPEILKAAEAGHLPPVFDQILPDAAKLVMATDGSIDFRTLKERFPDTYYDYVRKLAIEFERRCNEFTFPKVVRPSRFRKHVLSILDRFAALRK